jgi:putative aminopeptidase FrvX
MKKESLNFLFELLETPSPSGFEQKIQAVVKKRVSKYAPDITVDVHGNLTAVGNPKGKVKVMLAGHCDQIGMMIHYINDAGFAYLGQIGGLDPSVLPGSALVVHTRKGPVSGVLGYKPVHLTTAEDRGKKVKLSDLWLDIGAKDGAEAKKIISVGDPATYKLGVTRLGENIISSPGCDDRVGLFVIMEALRLFTERTKGKKDFPIALYSVSTVQEEIGLRGARTSCYGIDPLVGIAVDVTHASDYPGVDPKEVGTVVLGKGPTIDRGANINPILEDLFIDTAKKNKIDYQPLAAPGATGTDANAIQVTRHGVATALIGLPNRYMHTQVEACDLRDLENAAELIAETVMKITPKMTFIPV